VIVSGLAESTLSAKEKNVIASKCNVQHQEQLTAVARFNGFLKLPSLSHGEGFF